MNVKDVVVSSGAVLRCRPVPPYAMTDVLAAVEEPEYPFIDVKSDAGGSERLPALRDSPEYVAYQKDMRNFRVRQRAIAIEADLNIGVIEWRLPGTDEFVRMPPDDWKIPAMMSAYGVEPATDAIKRRVQFIKYELIMTENDDDLVMGVIRMSKPVTAEEVEAAAAPFESDAPEPAE